MIGAHRSREQYAHGRLRSEHRSRVVGAAVVEGDDHIGDARHGGEPSGKISLAVADRQQDRDQWARVFGDRSRDVFDDGSQAEQPLRWQDDRLVWRTLDPRHRRDRRPIQISEVDGERSVGIGLEVLLEPAEHPSVVRGPEVLQADRRSHPRAARDLPRHGVEVQPLLGKRLTGTPREQPIDRRVRGS